MDLLDDRHVTDDQADFTPLVELELAQALAADKGRLPSRTIAADVEPLVLNDLPRDLGAPLFSTLPSTRIFDPGFRPLLQQRDDLVVGDSAS